MDTHVRKTSRPRKLSNGTLASFSEAALVRQVQLCPYPFLFFGLSTYMLRFLMVEIDTPLLGIGSDALRMRFLSS